MGIVITYHGNDTAVYNAHKNRGCALYTAKCGKLARDGQQEAHEGMDTFARCNDSADAMGAAGGSGRGLIGR